MMGYSRRMTATVVRVAAATVAALVAALGFAANASALEDCPVQAPSHVVDSSTGAFESVAFDSKGRLFYTRSGQGKLMMIARSGAEPKTILDGIDGPGGIIFRRNGNVLVGYGDTIAQASDGEADPQAGLIEVDPKTRKSHVFVHGLQMANGVTRGPGGQIFASTDFGTGVDRILKGSVELGWAPLDSSNGMVVDSAKRNLFVNQTFTASPTIARIPLERSDRGETVVHRAGGGRSVPRRPHPRCRRHALRRRERHRRRLEGQRPRRRLRPLGRSAVPERTQRRRLRPRPGPIPARKPVRDDVRRRAPAAPPRAVTPRPSLPASARRTGASAEAGSGRDDRTVHPKRPKAWSGRRAPTLPSPSRQPPPVAREAPPLACVHGFQAPDIRRRRPDRGRRARRRSDDDQDRDGQPRGDDGADPHRRRRRGRPRPRRRASREGRRRPEDDRRRIADPGHRRHPLQPHARAEGDRRGRSLHPPQPGQHRRPREGRRGRGEGDRAQRADADRRQLRLAPQAPPRARADGSGRGSRHRGGRVRRADGGPGLHRLQGLDQVDERAEHDRRQPAPRREDPLPDPPRHHRGGDEVVGRAEVRRSGSGRCSPTGSATRSGSASRPSTPRRRSRSPGRSSRPCSSASAGRC